MPKARRSISLLPGLLIALPLVLSADTYNESAKWWFLDSVNPNWVCDDARASCYSTSPNQYSFFGIYLVRQAGYLYAYVQGGGSEGPCISPNGGDNFCVFRAPDTASGWTGQGVHLVNHWPRPSDGWFWQVRSAFFDSHASRFYLVASRTLTGSTNTIDVMDAKVGESTDGINFTWTTLLTSQRSQIGVRLEDYALVPHPTQPRVWVGTITWFTDTGGAYITPWKVDWNAQTVSLPNSSGVWQTLAIGGVLSFVPQAAYSGRITNIQSVNVNGANRLEAWGVEVVSYSAGSGVANNPCPPGYPNGTATSKYLENRASTQQLGSSTASFRIFEPNTLTLTTPWTRATSSVRGLPSDYLWALSWMGFRFDPGGREYFYTGSKDNVICTHKLTWNPWAGSGILVTKLEPMP